MSGRYTALYHSALQCEERVYSIIYTVNVVYSTRPMPGCGVSGLRIKKILRFFIARMNAFKGNFYFFQHSMDDHKSYLLNDWQTIIPT